MTQDGDLRSTQDIDHNTSTTLVQGGVVTLLSAGPALSSRTARIDSTKVSCQQSHPFCETGVDDLVSTAKINTSTHSNWKKSRKIARRFSLDIAPVKHINSSVIAQPTIVANELDCHFLPISSVPSSLCGSGPR